MGLSKITDLSNRYHRKNCDFGRKLPGLVVLCRDVPSDIEASVYEPVICLILQGCKLVSTADQTVEIEPGDALLVSHDLPVVSRITKASRWKPYLAVILSIDLQLIRGLYEQVADAPATRAGVRPLSAGPADPAWLAPLTRYLELMDSPLDARVLGPSILREIHYRLLLSPTGQMLRNLLVADSHASRVEKAIRQLRAGYRTSLKVADLAKAAGMSVSSFHKHFQAVTGTTPLQYQKDLRLIEARTLLTARNTTVSAAAYAVGYESPTHFSRDYRRKFGLPPSRDDHGSVSVAADGHIRNNDNAYVPAHR
jgi:AraC-like DNA-binding protein